MYFEISFQFTLAWRVYKNPKPTIYRNTAHTAPYLGSGVISKRRRSDDFDEIWSFFYRCLSIPTLISTFFDLYFNVELTSIRPTVSH